MNRRDEQVRAIIAHEAGDWFVAHRAGTLDGAQRRAFDEWVMASPIHVEEYLGVAAVARELGEAAADPEMPIEVILERARESDGANVHTLETPEPSPRAIVDLAHTARHWQFAAIAASLVVVVGTLLWWSGDGSAPERYVTHHGELRTWRLADNTVLRLNTDTAVSVRYGRTERTLELEHGQAFFEVAHEPDRRFRVIAGRAAVTALGTKFDVYRRADSTVVTVVQGQVAVSPAAIAPRAGAGTARWTWRVSAGEELHVTGDNLPTPPTRTAVERNTAWLHRQIAFEREPLATVVAEFNRSGTVPVLVKLQRPPPEINILAPTWGPCSSTSTRRPRRPAVKAHIRPAAPPPRTTIS